MVNTRLKGETLLKAQKLLDDLIDYLERRDIDYHLEGGTLLGFVRDGDFLEWDHDIDISIPADETVKFFSGRHKLWLKGYRVTKRRSNKDIGPINIGDLRIFKVKSLWDSFLKLFSNRVKDNQLVADVFIKFDDGESVYWLAKEKVMKVPNLHYQGFEEVSYNGRNLRAPLKYGDYLTLKYGDWSVQVKEWDCATDEKTVIG